MSQTILAALMLVLTFNPLLWTQRTASTKLQVQGQAEQQLAEHDAAVGGKVDSSALPVEPVTSDQVREIRELTGLAEAQRQMLDEMMPRIIASMPPYMPTDVFKDFRNSVFGPEMQSAVLKCYQAHHSAADAAAEIAFYKTPAGQRILAATPELDRDLKVAGERIGRDVMMEVLQRHQAEIDAAKREYEAAHPWSPTKN
jgi:hypothetical protein